MAGRTLDASAVVGLSKLPRQTAKILGIAAIILAIFFVDLAVPDQYHAIIFLNYFAIYFSARLKIPLASFCVVAAVSVLAAIEYYIKFGLQADVHLVNHLTILAVLWVVAIFVYRRVSMENERVGEMASAESQRAFLQLMKNSRFGTQIVSQEGEIVYANQTMANLLGYDSAETLLKIPPQNLVAPHDRQYVKDNLTAPPPANSGPTPVYEYDGLCPDGSTVRLQTMMQPIQWDGKLAFRRTYWDVSVRRNAEIALAESEQRYRDLIEENPLGIQISDQDNNRLVVNKALADLLGYDTPEELMSIPDHTLLPSTNDQAPVTLEDLEDPSADIPNSREIELIRKDGTCQPVQIFRRVLTWKGRKAIQRTYIDISERKRAEGALLASEQRYRDLVEQSPLGTQISDREGNRLMVNAALVMLLGYDSSEEFLAMPARVHLPPDHQRSDISTRELAEYGNDFFDNREINLVMKDGTILPVQVIRRLLIWEGQEAIQRTYLDISERKRAEDALIEGERQFRNLIEQAPLGIQIVDDNGNRLLVNKALVDLLGYDNAEEMAGLRATTLIAPHHLDLATPFEDLANPHKSIDDEGELDLIRKDGEVINTQIFRRRLVWEGRNAAQLTYVDLTERKRAEEVLANSESQYRHLFEESALAGRLSDAHGNRKVNRALVDLLGYGSAQELEAIPSVDVIALDDRDESISMGRILSGEAGLPTSREANLIRKDGSYVPVQMYWQKFDWDGVITIQRTYIDISERKKQERAVQERDKIVQELRQALARASQISTMGGISSVIAHELHQPLAAIANTAAAAQRGLSEESLDKEAVLDDMLPLIAQQADRAGRVIGGIRKMFEGRKPEQTVESFKSVVEEACHLAAEEAEARHVAIYRSVEISAERSLMDKVQIQQVIYNLLRNAFDALEDVPDKKITVSVENTDDHEARISVRDNGCGLPKELEQTLFEPFITSKEKGMGMGLYTCQQIVESHGGNIWADTNGGDGTTISFTLPLAAISESTGGPVH